MRTHSGLMKIPLQIKWQSCRGQLDREESKVAGPTLYQFLLVLCKGSSQENSTTVSILPVNSPVAASDLCVHIF